MKHSKIEDRLAVIGALVVLFGVSMAAEDALGDDAGISGTAKSIALENGIDLDIRLGDHTYMLIAEYE
jgi:hypothetical protein